MSEEFKINHEEARNAPGSPQDRTFDEVVTSFRETMRTELGDKSEHFDTYLTGYMTALDDFEIQENENLDGDAAIKICGEVLDNWRYAYGKKGGDQA